MTYKENVRAILECNFVGFKEEIIDAATQRICELDIPKGITIPPELIEKATKATVEVIEHIDWGRAIEVYNERPTGEWILNDKPWLATEGKCSACKARAHLIFGVNYCPHCGAKMKGEEE